MVGYLSNSITADVAVDSPLSFWFNKENGPTTISLPGTHGGGEITYTTVVKNNANAPVEVYRVIHEITNTDGDHWEGEEFDEVWLSKDNGPEQNITAMLCYIDNGGGLHPFSDIGSAGKTKARIIFAAACDETDALYTHPAATAIENDIRIVLNEGTIGNYDMKLCHVKDLSESCP
jgi:hypothetical protein